MPTPNMPSNSQENLKENFEQIKSEGDVRFKKIAQILRAAIAESAGEIKAGTTAVSPATKEFRDSVIQRVKETSQETLEEAQEVWANRTKEESFQDWLRAEVQAVVKAMKTTLKSKTGQKN